MGLIQFAGTLLTCLSPMPGKGESRVMDTWRDEDTRIRGRKDMLHSYRPLQRQQTLAGTRYTAHMDLTYTGTDKHADQHVGST